MKNGFIQEGFCKSDHTLYKLLPIIGTSNWIILMIIIKATIGFQRDNCYYSNTQLVKDTGMNIRTIKNALSYLCDKNLIKIKNIKGKPRKIIVAMCKNKDSNFTMCKTAYSKMINTKINPCKECNNKEIQESGCNFADSNITHSKITDSKNTPTTICKNTHSEGVKLHLPNQDNSISSKEMQTPIDNIKDKYKENSIINNRKSPKDDFPKPIEKIDSANNKHEVMKQVDKLKSKKSCDKKTLTPEKSEFEKDKKVKVYTENKFKAVITNSIIDTWCKVYTNMFDQYSSENPYHINKYNKVVRGQFNLLSNYMLNKNNPILDLNTFENILDFILRNDEFFWNKLEPTTLYKKIDYFRHNYSLHLQKLKGTNVIKGELANDELRKNRTSKEFLERYNRERKREGKEPVDKLPWQKS